MKRDTTFSTTFKQHKGNHADKWEGYLYTYDQLLNDINFKCVNLLELGINNGGSLEVFAKYFKEAKNIVGVDINVDCKNIKFSDNRITPIIGDASRNETREEISLISNEYDVLIDDASHISSDIIKNFINLAELVSTNGVYIIEDLCCSYWNNYGGGLSHQGSAINFLKNIIDIINNEHWDLNISLKTFFSSVGIKNISDQFIDKIAYINSISFYNSICVIRFSDSAISQKIGKRIARGTPSVNPKIGIDGQEIYAIAPTKKKVKKIKNINSRLIFLFYKFKFFVRKLLDFFYRLR